MDNDDQFPASASISNGSPIKPNDVHVMLAKAIHRHKNVIINPSSSIPRDKISQEKERAWETVRLEMVNAGIQRFSTRTWRTVRDVDWQHLRRRVVNKIAENLKLYQNANKDLNELDILVLDTLGKISDGTIDFSDLIKLEPTDEMPKSVSSDKSENNYEPTDSALIVSTTNLLAEMIEGYGSNGKSLKRNSSPLQNDYAKKRNCADNDCVQQNSTLDDTKQLNDFTDSNLMPANETRSQWETLLREFGIGRKDEDGVKDADQVENLKIEQEKYKLEAEKYKADQERYKAQQEKFKSEIEKIRLEEAKIRLSRLRKE